MQCNLYPCTLIVKENIYKKPIDLYLYEYLYALCLNLLRVMSGNVDGSVWGQILIADPKYKKEVNNLYRELMQDALKFVDELKLQDE